MTRVPNRFWTITCVSLALTVTTAACGRMTADEANADEAVDSTESTQAEGALIAQGFEDDGTGAPGGLTAANLTAAAVSRGAARFQPAGCATVSAAAHTLTYVLAGCTGRFGLVHVTGTLTATLADSTGGVTITVTGTDLKANRATLNVSATAVLTDDAGTRKLVVTTHGSGVGPRGNSFTRDGAYTVSHNSVTDCLSLDGQWTLDLSIGRTRTTTVSGLQRCEAMCPVAGGEIVHTGLLGRTVTVTFTGGAEAAWSSSTGKSGTVELTCGG